MRNQSVTLTLQFVSLVLVLFEKRTVTTIHLLHSLRVVFVVVVVVALVPLLAPLHDLDHVQLGEVLVAVVLALDVRLLVGVEVADVDADERTLKK